MTKSFGIVGFKDTPLQVNNTLGVVVVVVLLVVVVDVVVVGPVVVV